MIKRTDFAALFLVVAFPFLLGCNQTGPGDDGGGVDPEPIDKETGWVFFIDNEHTASDPQRIPANATALLEINAGRTIEEWAGTKTGTYDPATNTYHPQAMGAAGVYRIRLQARVYTGQPDANFKITYEVGGEGEYIAIDSRSIASSGTFGNYFPVSVTNAFFVGETFLENGGQVYIETEDEGIEITSASIYYQTSTTP